MISWHPSHGLVVGNCSTTRDDRPLACFSALSTIAAVQRFFFFSSTEARFSALCPSQQAGALTIRFSDHDSRIGLDVHVNRAYSTRAAPHALLCCAFHTVPRTDLAPLTLVEMQRLRSFESTSHLANLFTSFGELEPLLLLFFCTIKPAASWWCNVTTSIMRVKRRRVDFRQDVRSKNASFD